MELLHLFFIGNLWVSPRICFYSSMIFFIPPNVVPDAVFLHRRKELIGMIAPPSQLTMSKSEVFCEKKPKWRDTTKRYRWVTQKAKSSFCHHIPAMFQMFQFLVIPPAPPPEIIATQANRIPPSLGFLEYLRQVSHERKKTRSS